MWTTSSHQRSLSIWHSAGYLFTAPPDCSAAVNNFSAQIDGSLHETPAAKKDHPLRVVCAGGKKLSGGCWCGRWSFGRGFGLGDRFLALQIGLPPLAFLSFIVLLAHNAVLHSGRISNVELYYDDSRGTIQYLFAGGGGCGPGGLGVPVRRGKEAPEAAEHIAPAYRITP